MFLLYFAILSALTPPIAVAALAAAAIAQEDPILIAVSAVRLAVVGFLIPFVFLWNPAILGLADPLAVTLAIVGGICAVTAIAVSLEWARFPGGAMMAWPVRLALVAAAVAAVAPEVGAALLGIGSVSMILGAVYFYSRRSAAAGGPVSAD
jgi:TRAP-type uncharacterized transport system fused permease subunit